MTGKKVKLKLIDLSWQRVDEQVLIAMNSIHIYLVLYNENFAIDDEVGDPAI